MRPNIDISHELSGKVKDYAEEHDLDLDEAYRELIQQGLDYDPEKQRASTRV